MVVPAPNAREVRCRWLRESQAGIEGAFKLSITGPLFDKYYEPFVVVKRVEANGVTLPRYGEQYVGRFKNKISFVTQLRGNHYRFYTLRQEFLTHIPHPISNQSTDAMQAHLLNMRVLHRQDRRALDRQWTSGAKPPLEKSPFDSGIDCLPN